MYQGKKQQLALRNLMLTVILLLLCISLMVGITWARYYAEDTSYQKYIPREPAAVSLWADYDADAETDPLSGRDEIAWVFYEGNGILECYISNGTYETDYPDEDLSVSIRLMSSLSITDAQVSLSVGDDGSAWFADPVQIEEGTPLFDTFGGGNAYVFLDKDGAELSWDLEGGTLSVLPIRIEVSNLEQAEDAALLQLQVVGR